MQSYPFGDGIIGILDPESTGSIFRLKVLSQFDGRFFWANDCLLLLVIINTMESWSVAGFPRCCANNNCCTELPRPARKWSGDVEKAFADDIVKAEMFTHYI